LNKYTIISSKPGQLGNRLIVFAHFIAFAAEKGTIILNPSFDEYASWFEGTRRSLWCKFPQRIIGSKRRVPLILRSILYQVVLIMAKVLKRFNLFHSLIQVKYLDWDEEFDIAQFAEVQAQILIVQGWLYRCPSLIKKHGNLIRSFFRPTNNFLSAVDSFLQVHRAEVLVGVHIRRGDYKTFLNGKYFYDLELYHKKMKEIQTFFPGRSVRFCICSNVPINAKFSFSNLDCVNGPGSVVEDLMVLTRCNYILGPPSTFTIWASFYGSVPLYQMENINRKIELSDFLVYEEL
jgi:hypothetical protein